MCYNDKIKEYELLNRNLPIPLYYQLVLEIKEKIESGYYKPGDMIPKELELSSFYNISRATVHQALVKLTNDGYLRRVKAKGTFVNSLPEMPKFVATLKGFAGEMREKGIDYATKVLENKIISPPVKIAEKLNITQNERVFYLKRLRFIQNEPVLISESYIPINFCPDIIREDFEKESLYNVMEKKYNIFLNGGTRDFEAIILYSDTERKLLGISSSTPILHVEGIIYEQNNLPVEYVKIDLKGKFSVNLVQP